MMSNSRTLFTKEQLPAIKRGIQLLNKFCKTRLYHLEKIKLSDLQNAVSRGLGYSNFNELQNVSRTSVEHSPLEHLTIGSDLLDKRHEAIIDELAKLVDVSESRFLAEKHLSVYYDNIDSYRHAMIEDSKDEFKTIVSVINWCPPIVVEGEEQLRSEFSNLLPNEDQGIANYNESSKTLTFSPTKPESMSAALNRYFKLNQFYYQYDAYLLKLETKENVDTWTLSLNEKHINRSTIPQFCLTPPYHRKTDEQLTFVIRGVYGYSTIDKEETTVDSSNIGKCLGYGDTALWWADKHSVLMSLPNRFDA